MLLVGLGMEGVATGTDFEVEDKVGLLVVECRDLWGALFVVEGTGDSPLSDESPDSEDEVFPMTLDSISVPSY